MRLAEVLSSLSHALDLTEGQPSGHTLRTAAIGMRLADELSVPEEDREALYYALLLKDAGCSSNASRMAVLFGSADQDAKYRMKLVDWHHAARLALHTLGVVGSGRSVLVRAAHFLKIARTKDVTRELIAIRCDRGAEIVRQIGFPEKTALAVRSLDEHWNGRGYPDGLAGDAIPLLSRIALVAQTTEIFLSAKGLSGTMHMLRQRRGSWFDPMLVSRILGWRADREWWLALRDPELAGRVVAMEPGATGGSLNDADLDRVARAFAEIIDAKSPFTYHHSSNVARLAADVGAVLGFDETERRRIQRAGLLHDIGKLGISNRILDKGGPLTAAERREIERHPVYSQEILNRVRPFRDFADPAVLHHEKLDGSGYPWRVPGDRLEPAARVLAVVDIFEALTADRPYRRGMSERAALAIIQREAGTLLCGAAVEALEAHVAQGGTQPIG